MIKKVFLIFFFFSLIQGSNADDSLFYDYRSKSLNLPDTSVLQEYRNSPDFQYGQENHQTSWWQDFVNWIKSGFIRFWEKIFGKTDPVNFGYIINTIFYVLLAGFLALLFWFILRVSGKPLFLKDKKLSAEILDIRGYKGKPEELEDLIGKAVQNRNYKFAIRYALIDVLRRMAEQSLIQWQKDKTNRDYLQEVRNSRLHEPLRGLSLAFERAYYGNYAMSEEDFTEKYRLYEELKKEIGEAGR